MSVILIMEVPRRPLPTFTSGGAAAEDPLRVESSEKSLVSRLTEPPGPEDASSEVETKLSSEDSFSEDGSASEDTSSEETRRTSEEEEAAKERAAQRQLLAVEELVQSERNYLRMLQVCTVTIRSNLMKLQVPSTHARHLFQIPTANSCKQHQAHVNDYKLP